MKYLTDTHIFLWWILENPKLKNRVKAIIQNKNNILYLSAASTWEMIIKSGAGKLSLPDSPETFIRKQLLLNDICQLRVEISRYYKNRRLQLATLGCRSKRSCNPLNSQDRIQPLIRIIIVGLRSRETNGLWSVW